MAMIFRYYDYKTSNCRLQRIVFETGAEVQQPANSGGLSPSRILSSQALTGAGLFWHGATYVRPLD